MVEIAIRGDTIRLGQLLKLAGAIGSGAEVKALLAAQDGTAVRVNGEPETRRGRQLHPGDVVEVAGTDSAAGEQWRLVSAEATG